MKKILSWLVGLMFTLIVLIMGIWCFWFFASDKYTLTGVPVLNYHQVNDKYKTVLTMTPEDFDTQMEYLHTHGYHAITQKQFEAYMLGHGELPDRPVLITFDDGYVDNYEHAYPIMKKYGFTGTIFIIVDLVGKPGYLTWEQIREMSRNGIEFGSHTVSHKPLTSFDRDGIRRELRESKQALERELQKPCIAIAFPEGEFNDVVMEETKAAGYKYGFTVDTGRDFPSDNPFGLERVPMFEVPLSFEHFYFRLHFSALSAKLWRMHKYLEKSDVMAGAAEYVPEP